MNQDEKSLELGLPGITNAVEDVIVARDILLAKETGAKVYTLDTAMADGYFNALYRNIDTLKEALG